MLYRSVDAYGNPISDAPSAPGIIEKKYKNPVLSTVRTANVMVPSGGGANVKSVDNDKMMKVFEGRLADLQRQNAEILDKLQSIFGLLDKIGQSKVTAAVAESDVSGLSLDNLDSKPWVALGISKSGYYAKKKANEL